VRRLLGRPGALSGPALSLPGDGSVRFDIDVLAAARWQEAAELEGLGGELLEGMQFPGCAAFETWLTGERRRFAALTEAVLQDATLHALSVGSLGDGVGYASRLVTLNPLADTHQELLIRAYTMSGDRPAARRQLESAVRLFRRELGCDPQPSVFLAAEAGPAKVDGPSTPARVRALLEAGQAQVTAGAVGAAVQVLRAACDEADAAPDAALAATAHLALGSALIGAGTARHQEGEIALQRAINLAQDPASARPPRPRTATWPDPTSYGGSTPAPTTGWRRPSRWGAAKPARWWRRRWPRPSSTGATAKCRRRGTFTIIGPGNQRCTASHGVTRMTGAVGGARCGAGVPFPAMPRARKRAPARRWP